MPYKTQSDRTYTMPCKTRSDKTYMVDEDSSEQKAWVCYDCNRVWSIELEDCSICGAFAVQCEMCKCTTVDYDCSKTELKDENGYVTVEYERLCDSCVESLKNAFGYKETISDEEDIT